MQYTRTNEWYLRGNKDIYWCSDQESWIRVFKSLFLKLHIFNYL
jgi:hypothetical protein